MWPFSSCHYYENQPPIHKAARRWEYTEDTFPSALLPVKWWKQTIRCMPISLYTMNITKTIYLICSENRQQWLVDTGCFKFGRQHPDFLLLLVLSANEEERFLTYSDTNTVTGTKGTYCKHGRTAVEWDARGCSCRAVLNTSFAWCDQLISIQEPLTFHRAELSTTGCHCSMFRGEPRSLGSWPTRSDS